MRFSIRSVLVGFLFVAVLCMHAPFVHKVPDRQTYVVEAVNGIPTYHIQHSKEEHFELNEGLLELILLEALVLIVWFGYRLAKVNRGKKDSPR